MREGRTEGKREHGTSGEPPVAGLVLAGPEESGQQVSGKLGKRGKGRARGGATLISPQFGLCRIVR
jgi:hypothetical protein